MGAKFLQLLTDIFVNIPKGVEVGWRDSSGPRIALDSGAQVLLGRAHQSAIGVIDHHEFFRTQQVMRHEQRAQSIVRDNPASVADDMRVSRF